MHSSLFICFPKALLTGFSLPMEMISSAHSIAKIQKNETSEWRCHVVSSNDNVAESVKLANGIRILPDCSLDTAPKADTIFIPPIWGNPDAVINRNKSLIKWLQLQKDTGCKFIATGTGVCLLADSGLLDGKVATTHWYYFDKFEKKYPQINLKRHHFIIQDGAITSIGSINALLDYVLYLIENHYGQAVSQVVEQHYSHEIDRSFDKPWFSAGDSRHPDEGIIEVQQWMQTHFYQSFDLSSLSELANMSSRHFSRRFKTAVGKSPFAYINDLKINAAKELLRETNLLHQEIADQLGYTDGGYFSRCFKQSTKLTPGEYRQMVRAKLFSTEHTKDFRI